MAKNKKKKQPKLGVKDIDPRMMRVNQRAHKFTDRKKQANKNACRNWRAA
jgi:hypothetical protein